MIRIPVRILFILWSKKSPPRSLPCFSRIWAEFCINKWILTGYDYAINSSNNLTTKMAVHSTLTSKRTLCRHLLWGETQESSPQSREGKGCLREQVYFKRPLMRIKIRHNLQYNMEGQWFDGTIFPQSNCLFW